MDPRFTSLEANFDAVLCGLTMWEARVDRRGNRASAGLSARSKVVVWPARDALKAIMCAAIDVVLRHAGLDAADMQTMDGERFDGFLTATIANERVT